MEVFESDIRQVFVKLLDGKHKILNFTITSVPVAALKHRIQTLTAIPSHLQLLLFNNSRVLQDHQSLDLVQSRQNFSFAETLDSDCSAQFPENGASNGWELRDKAVSDKSESLGNFPVVVHLLLRLRGGKGGFGSLLRGAATKAGQKKTNNFDACRDMSGRRLRHVNAEKKLEEWRAEAEERKLEKMADDFIKKKTKELVKSGKSNGNDSAEKYVAKYRKDSAKCMEEVERSVRESFKGLVSSKRKDSAQGSESDSKRLRIWLGKQKLGDSDSEVDSDEEGDDLKSILTNNVNHSDSSIEADRSSGSVTGEKIDSGSIDQGRTGNGSEGEENVSEESLKLGESMDACGHSDDGNGTRANNHALESLEEDVNHNGVDIKVTNNSKLEEMISQPYGVSSSVEEVPSAAEVSNHAVSVLGQEGVSASAKVPDLDKPLNFEEYNSATELEVLGMERLKAELQARGLKCGGTLQERAARIFLLKTTPLEMIPKKLLAKK